MRWSSKLRLRLRSLFQRDAVERELDSELRFHLEEQIAENIASGMKPDEAKYAASRAMGGITQIAEQCREARNVGLVETTWHDLRFGARMLAKNPAFSTVAVLTLAVGIGFNTMSFSAVTALLFGGLPVKDPDRLVLGEALREGFDPAGTSLLQYTVLRGEQKAFASTALSIDRSFLLRGNTEAEQVHVAAVSPGFFETLGTAPILGRDLSREESRPGGPAAVLLAYGFWQRRFGGDPNVIGQSWFWMTAVTRLLASCRAALIIRRERRRGSRSKSIPKRHRCNCARRTVPSSSHDCERGFRSFRLLKRARSRYVTWNSSFRQSVDGATACSPCVSGRSATMMDA